MRPLQRTWLILGVLVASALVSFLLTGSRLVSGVPSPSATGHEDALAMTFAGSDGAQLAALWFDTAAPKGVVVLAHPALATRADMFDRAQLLLRENYAVLVYDQRAHGASDGKHVTHGALEAGDLRAATAVARARQPAVPIIVHGVGLGAAAAVLAGAQLDADALIIEALYPTVAAAIEHRLRLRYGAVAPFLTGWFAQQLEWRLEVSLAELDPVRALPAIDRPLLMIAASEDPVTPARETLWMYGSISARKKLWLVGGAAGQDLYQFKPDEYAQRMLSFLDTVSAN